LQNNITNTGLKIEIIEELKQIFSSNTNIESVILFGSRAKGNFKNGSDIDLALKGNNLLLKDIYSLQNKIDELNLPYTFDIQIYKNIKEPALKSHIDCVGIVIYTK
jgi:uncharacterized protein